MVAIKDMEMPKCCKECPLFHFYLDTNGAIHFICKCGNMEMCGDLKNKRNDFCPLIEADKWIFVSDRVPDKNGKYLVTRYNSLIGSSICVLCYAENLYDIDRFDFYGKKGKSGWYDYDSEWGHVEFDDVMGWMPLPEPCKADSEGDKK